MTDQKPIVKRSPEELKRLMELRNKVMADYTAAVAEGSISPIRGCVNTVHALPKGNRKQRRSR